MTVTLDPTTHPDTAPTPGAETPRPGPDAPASTTRALPTSGLGRALLVLDHMADNAPNAQGVSAVARTVGLPKTVVHRILKELTASGYLDFDPSDRQYTLGHRALQLGMATLRSRDVPGIALPFLQRLVGTTRETATLSVRRHCERTYIRQVLSPQEVRMSVTLGVPYPLHAGSSSKAILAALPPHEADACLSGDLTALTPSTLVDAAALRRDLEIIRERGWAESLGERQADAGSVAAPLRTVDGAVFGSISLCGPVSRFTAAHTAELGPLVHEAAHQISQALGYLGDLFGHDSPEAS